MSDASKKNLFLPPAVIDRVMADAAPAGFHIAKDARTAAHTVANIFVMMVSTLSGDAAHASGRSVVQRADVEQALEDCGLAYLIPTLRIGPGAVAAPAPSTTTTTTTTTPAPPRKKNAYMIFCGEQRKVVLEARPGLKMTDVQKELAKIWGGLSEGDKQRYQRMAAGPVEVQEEATAVIDVEGAE